MRKVLIIIALTALLITSGCKLMEAVTGGLAATGVITPDQAKGINSGAKVAGKAFDAMKDITPEQEYYIGRSVGATVLKTYKVFDNNAANMYLNTLGQALAMVSDLPETFGGYHFLVMNTDEVNAFGAPGGLIFVSRGLLKCCKNEDMVAAILAHEIGHVQNKHGLRAIKKSRWTGTVTTALAEAGKNLGGEQLAQLTEAFEGAIDDIAATMVNSGYARKLETEADMAAITIMKRLGYNPAALRDMLMVMDKQMDHSGGGFAKTHPDPKDRVADIDKEIKATPVKDNTARQKRFKAALGSI